MSETRGINFGNWDEALHDDYNQVKRMASSQLIKSKNSTVHKDTQTAEITGRDDTYNVTLNSCTCFDFKSRQLPCKHVYYLAHELGYLDILPKTNREAAAAFKDNLPAEIEHFKDLYFSGAISGEKFNRIVNALTSK